MNFRMLKKKKNGNMKSSFIEKYLAVDQRSNGQIPSSIGGHDKAQKRPNPVVVERGDEHCSSTACTKDVGPCSLVQLVIYIVYVTEKLNSNLKKKKKL